MYKGNSLPGQALDYTDSIKCPCPKRVKVSFNRFWSIVLLQACSCLEGKKLKLKARDRGKRKAVCVAAFCCKITEYAF